MTKNALDVNELLCDNNTVKTHLSIGQIFKKKNLAF